MEQYLYINPAVRMNPASDGLLQFRFPDSRHVTIECDAHAISAFLTRSDVLKTDQWVAGLCQAPLCLDEGLASEVLAMLQQICVLIPQEFTSNTKSGSIFMHEHLVTRAAKGSFQFPTFNSISITGEGQLASVLKETVDNLELPASDTDADSEFKIIVADSPDFRLLRSATAEAGDAAFKSTVWFDDGSLRLGPLQVKGESACFECFVSRCEATAHFYEEAVAFHNGKGISPNELPLGRLERNLALFATERYLRLVHQGQFDQIEPGHVESWNLLTGEKDTLPVLRNPYCVCGAKSSRPSRAVRDII